MGSGLSHGEKDGKGRAGADGRAVRATAPARAASPAGVGPHPPRSRAQRAAQFMPFSALTGLEELLRAEETKAACREPVPWPGGGGATGTGTAPVGRGATAPGVAAEARR